MKRLAVTTVALAAAFHVAAAETNGPHANPEDQFRGVWFLQYPSAPDFLKLGFNAFFVPLHGYSVAKDLVKPSLAETRGKWLDFVEANDADYFESLGGVPGDAEMVRRHPQLRADGKPGRQADMLSPAARREAQAWVARIAATVPKNRPGFAGISPASEVRDKSFPTTSADAQAAWAAASGGRPMPDHRNSGIAPHYSALKGFPVSRIVDDADPLLAFYRWYWREGDGWNGYCTETVDTYERALGRKLVTFYDPAVRVPPVWGSGGAVSHLNHWTYVYPEPFNISFVTTCTEAMARGRPGQRVFAMAQAISYRSELAPIPVEPKGTKPAWAISNPKAPYISTPPDLMREALWTLFSHKLDGIFTHGWQSVLDCTAYGFKPGSYAYTNDGTKEAFSNAFARAGVPLGPLFKALPEAESDVAVLESAPAWFFARVGGWGGGGSRYNAIGTMTTLANLMPRVLYDEEIAETGIPPNVKVLLMPGCDVLAKTTFEAVRRFQAKGGVVFGDANLAPRILPDALLPVCERTRKAATDVPAFRKAAMALKASVARYCDLVADTDRDDIFVRVRRMPAADCLFAINDRRGPGDYVGPWGIVWEKGLPNGGRVSVRRAAGAVYDLVEHRPVPFEVRDGRTFVDVSYETTDGKVLLVADRPLAPLKAAVRGGTVTVRTPDTGLMVPIRIDRAGAKPFYAVVKDGIWTHDFGTANGVSVTCLADGRVSTVSGDHLQAVIDQKRAEEEAALKLAIPPDRETYLFKTMKHAFPKLRKIGAVSPWGECSPFVFKGRLMRMELADLARGFGDKNSTCCALIRDVETGKVVGRTGEGCYYQSVYVEGDAVYITGTRRQPGLSVTYGDTILLFESKDLVNWTSREMLSRPGWHFYNSTMTKGPDGYVIALESDNLKHARRYFTMFFATSKDMKDWTFLPDEKAYPKQRYCGGPFLKHVDGWYYLSLVQEMPCERWCTYLFRSKDLSEWECGRYNPMLMWDDDDRRVSEKAADITLEFAERIRTGFVCNASDVEFCEFGGKTCIDYLVGDQRGFYYMAEAWYDGPLKEYLERQFE